MAEWERPSLSSGSGGPRFRKKRSRWRRFLGFVVLAAAGGFGWIAWSAYQEGRVSDGNGVVPFLRADTAPTRIRPNDPGGMPVPNQDKTIYNEIDPRSAPPKGVERLLPPPETPVDRPPRSIPTLGETVPPPPPREVTTVTPHAIAEPKPSPQTLAPAPSPFHKLEAPPATSKPTHGTTPQVASTAPSAPVPKPTSSGGPRVQLAAVGSETEAHKEWERLLRANGDLLGSLSPTIVRADLGAKGVVYRVQAGPFASAEAASDLCGRLKSRKVGCFVAR